MAIKLPKVLTGADAKSRVIILLAVLVGFFLIVYFAVSFFNHGNTGPGGTKIANAPAGLQSVPGGQLSPEYSRALTQANVQAAQQAQMTGGSAVPTLINTAAPVTAASTGECTVLCPSEDKVTVADDINDLVKSGKISQATANQLLDLAKKNVSVDEYAAALDQLVREGKLTPEQARALLEKYKKQHMNAMLADTARTMDALIKNGQLPLSTANELLELQKKGLTPSEYAAELQRLVAEGKLSPAAASALLAKYTQQYQQELGKSGAFAISQMAKSGEITPDVAKALTDMQNKKVPVDQYAAQLDQLVKQGKMTPEAAAKLLALYKAMREGEAVATCLQPLVTKGGESANEFHRLIDLQLNNATLGQYTEELKHAVQIGIVSPEMAACALQQYQTVTSIPAVLGSTAAAVPLSNLPGAQDFAALQQRVQTSQQQAASQAAKQAASETFANTAGNGNTTSAEAQQFAAAQAQKQAEANQARQDRVQALQSAMSAQAQSLLTAWQPPTMAHVTGAAEEEDKTKNAASGSTASTAGKEGASTKEEAAIKPSLIKAGTIYFAILETGVDSDYPDTPVMATIVQGPFKGAKLIGKLSLAQGQDKVSLNFTTMDEDEWPAAKSISAFAIDPDTARTVLASNVDYHYLKRYGAIMGAAFVQGYSSAITQAGTSTTGIFGTSSVHPELSSGNKLAVGFGQVGTTMGQALSSYINTPTTVKVNSGVGIGILFSAPVTE